jgi:hypothetical protein
MVPRMGMVGDGAAHAPRMRMVDGMVRHMRMGDGARITLART